MKERLQNHLHPSFRSPPNSESEVQNVTFALLRQIDSSAEREYRGVRLAGKDFTIDFSLFKNRVGVEVKLIKEKTRLGQIIDEVNANIPAYIKQFARVIFVIYDACGRLAMKQSQLQI